MREIKKLRVKLQNLSHAVIKPLKFKELQTIPHRNPKNADRSV